jgi:anti-anti-sigma regulatory factor
MMPQNRSTTMLEGETVDNQLRALRTVLRCHPDVLYVIDPQTYEVLLVNNAFEDILGEDPVGKKCHEVFQGFDCPCDFCTNDIILSTREPYSWEFHNTKVDRVFWITDQIIPWPDGRDVRLEVATDITQSKQTEHELRERTKELNCLLSLSDLVDRNGKDWDALAQGAVDLIPAAWQYPEIATARLTLGRRHYVSDGFRETPWILRQPLQHDGNTVGQLEVAYLEERPPLREGPFLAEERVLLNALAERLGHIHAKIQNDAELDEHRQRLEALVAERTEALESSLARSQMREQVISRQTEEILELSTPVLEMWQGLVVAPLIGTLDSERTLRFMERLLTTIVERRAVVALIDITGVPTLDTSTAQHLVDAVTVARLLGARVVLTGVAPRIAQTLVQLGIDLHDIETRASLSQGLALALESIGMVIHGRIPQQEAER